VNTDERIELAYSLARELASVDHNELSKWMEFLKAKRDLSKALDLAAHLSKSPSLRTGPRNSYQLIFNVLNRSEKLGRLPLKELLEIMGYTRRIIIWQSAKAPKKGRRERGRRRGGR